MHLHNQRVSIKVLKEHLKSYTGLYFDTFYTLYMEGVTSVQC